MNDAIDAYLRRVSLRETDVQRRLREETAALDEAGMQICPEQGQLMRMLAGLVGARRAIEVGVFTGYSALSVALALPEDGELVACDVNEEWTTIARRYWSEAGVASKITLRIAPALETLEALVREGRSGEFDIAFIDADKTGYDAYYERCLDLLRSGGLVLVDNVLQIAPSASGISAVVQPRHNPSRIRSSRVLRTLLRNVSVRNSTFARVIVNGGEKMFRWPPGRTISPNRLA